MDLLIIRRGCPNCGESIDDTRLTEGFPCNRCIQDTGKDICEYLEKVKKLKGFKSFCEVEKKLNSFENFFEKSIGSKPWSLQKLWAKRALKGKSFAVIAPTGVGKTTFGFIFSLFTKPKSILLFPTRLLAIQADKKLKELSGKLSLKKEILLYKPSKKIREKFLNGDFDILCGTNMFLHKNFEHLLKFKFSFLFIDDIDSFLKSSKNIENLFKLLGFEEKDIKLALKEKKNLQEQEKLARLREKKRETVLIVSSATAKPKGGRIKLFKNLLGFDVQKANLTLRNIVDVANPVKNLEEALYLSSDLIKQLGKGGLVFLSVFYKKEKVKEVVQFYREKGIKTVSYLEHKPAELNRILAEGNFDVAVGISHLSNPLVRGVDLPHIIRYALFLDIPKHIFPVDFNVQPSRLHSLLLTVFNLLEKEDRLKAVSYIKYLRKYLTLKEEQLDRYPRIKEKVFEIGNFLKEKLEDREFLRKIENSEDVSLKKIDNQLCIVVADAATYIQASGRTSRFTAGGMTKGLSVLFYEDVKAFNSLKKRLSAYFMQTEVEFKDLKDIELTSLLKEIDRDRNKALAFIEKKNIESVKDLFRTALIVVESPVKAKTIAGFFGKPQIRLIKDLPVYEVPLENKLLMITASMGHLFDIVTDKGFFGILDNNGKYVPLYDTIKRCKSTGLQHTELSYLRRKCPDSVEDKINTVEALKEVAHESDEIFIATDPDAEGEKIAYDLFLMLKPFNSDIKRAEFHEVTPKAFRKALKEYRQIDKNLVKAQIVRRILDRWVGFSLSRILWKIFGKNWLSAGRVQTPVLGWIIQRYKESRLKKGEILLQINNIPFKIQIEDIKLCQKVYAEIKEDRLKLIKGSQKLKNPLPPYSTDTILEEAGEKLHFSADKTMSLLQHLFESGLITYHRTDSIRVSEAGRYTVARSYIVNKFGEEYFYPRLWEEKGTHECIRPTRPLDPTDLSFMITAELIDLEEEALKLYELIFKRFMASQMRPAKVITGELILELPNFSWKEEVVVDTVEHGFDLIYPTFFPLGEDFLKITAKKLRKVPQKPLFTQGTLIQEMKKRGLGRPSTYAHIVQTLLERGYVKEVKGKLIPTKRGIEIYKYLAQNYGEYVSEELTRKLEEAMDKIERGELDYLQPLREIYGIKNILSEDTLGEPYHG